jgi:hypothetical protein
VVSSRVNLRNSHATVRLPAHGCLFVEIPVFKRLEGKLVEQLPRRDIGQPNEERSGWVEDFIRREIGPLSSDKLVATVRVTSR